MKIAILGWGSLIWNLEDLKIINNEWFHNGPVLPIEFARISNGGRLTLVIKPNWDEVTTFYAISSLETLDEAIENLSIREGTGLNKIGYYNFLDSANSLRIANQPIISKLVEWKKHIEIDAVIWTDLAPKFKDSIGLDFDLAGIKTFLECQNSDEFL